LGQARLASISSHLRLQAFSAQHQQHHKTSLQILHSRSVKHRGSYRALAACSGRLQNLLYPLATSLALLQLQLRPLKWAISSTPPHRLLLLPQTLAYSVRLHLLPLQPAV
jgi:hypothetical protein